MNRMVNDIYQLQNNLAQSHYHLFLPGSVEPLRVLHQRWRV